MLFDILVYRKGKEKENIQNILITTSSLAAFTTTAALYVLATMYTIAVLVTVFHNTQILDRDYRFYTPTLDAIGTAVLTITISSFHFSVQCKTDSCHPLDRTIQRRRVVACVGTMGTQ